MAKHDNEEQGKHSRSTQHDKDAQPGSAQATKPTQPGSPEDKDNLHHEHERTRVEHDIANPTPNADDRTDGQRQRDEQLASGGRPYTDQPSVAGAGQAVNEQLAKHPKVNTPPDSPLVVPTNNADPPVATTPWNPPQGQAAQQQTAEAEELKQKYDPNKPEAHPEAQKDASKNEKR